MPKKIRNCFDKNLTFEKLLLAHKRARQHKVYRNEVIQFEINLENNIVNLLNSIKNGTYHVGKYSSFLVFEPKERLIKKLPYIDRIVHQWYIEEFIKPFFYPRLIKTTFACIDNRGTHKAVIQVQKYMQTFKRNYGDFWILKCDIHKFFYSIDPNILFRIMQKYIADKKLLAFTHKIIFERRTIEEKVGIPIGNFTSQFFANIYLNELDQFVKRKLKVKYYARYMDDFIFLFKTKADCIMCKKIVESFLKENLHLSLNDKSRYYPYKMGVDFCGYRIFCTHRLLRHSSKKKIKNNVRKWNTLFSKNKLDIKHTMECLNAWKGHSSHCNSYTLQNQIINKCNFIFDTSCSLQHIEQDLIDNINIWGQV